MAEKKVLTPTEKLAAKIAEMRLCPGNEALKYADTIVKLVHEFDRECELGLAEEDERLYHDVDLETGELLKNDKTIMEGIVSLSKLVSAMHAEIKRINPNTQTGGVDGKGGADTDTNRAGTEAAQG